MHFRLRCEGEPPQESPKSKVTVWARRGRLRGLVHRGRQHRAAPGPAQALAVGAQAGRVDEVRAALAASSSRERDEAVVALPGALVLRPRPLLLVVEQALAAREAAATARHGVAMDELEPRSLHAAMAPIPAKLLQHSLQLQKDKEK